MNGVESASPRLRRHRVLTVALLAAIVVGLGLWWDRNQTLSEIERLRRPPTARIEFDGFAPETPAELVLRRHETLWRKVTPAPRSITLGPKPISINVAGGLWDIHIDSPAGLSVIPVLAIDGHAVRVDGRPAAPGLIRIPVGPCFVGLDADLAEVVDPDGNVVTQSYQIGRTEVTIGEYREFLVALGRHRGENGPVSPRQTVLPFGPWCSEVERAASPAGCLGHRPVVEGKDVWKEQDNVDRLAQSVRYVSWYDARAYGRFRHAQAAKEATTKAAALIYRLPSRSEWEKAARGVDGRPFAWGFDPGDTARRVMDGGFGRADDKPALASPYGLLHTDSGVAEWIDAHEGADRRVVMGRTWDLHTDRVHLGYGLGESPWYRGPYVGFRILAEEAR